jgi:hypothetical protein
MDFGPTLGGFTAVATISMARMSGGLSDDGKKHTDEDMKMDGKLVTFYYGSKETLRHKTKTNVYIQIEFKEYPQENVFGYDETKYIGDIRLREENTEVLAFVDVTLPISMYPTLQSMKGEQIKVETIHELISNPNHVQKTDNIVAFIKRIYFEIQPVNEDGGPRK